MQIKDRDTGEIIYEDGFKTIKETVETVAANKIRLNNADLRGLDFRGCNLSGCDMPYSNFSKCDFRGADLIQAYLRGCNFHGSDFRGCDMREADVTDSDFGECDLRGADWRDADFDCCDTRTIKWGVQDGEIGFLHERFIEVSKVPDIYKTELNEAKAKKVVSEFQGREHEFIKSNNLSLNDFRAFQHCLDEYARTGETRVFISNVANLFKKYGFSVDLDENRVNYVIKADSTQNNIETDRKYYIPNVPFELNKQMRELGCKWDPDAKSWYHTDPIKAKEAERLVNEALEKGSPSIVPAVIEKINHEM